LLELNEDERNETPSLKRKARQEGLYSAALSFFTSSSDGWTLAPSI
jgi:hypothetical protein